MTDQNLPSLIVFDLSVTRNSPAGSCVLSQLMELRKKYDITVFSDQCDIKDAVKWVRVPLPPRPVFLRYWIFHILALIKYGVWRIGNSAPALVQSTQGQFLWPDVCYAHFCHGSYLRNQWKESASRGLRRGARWINHAYNAFAERRAFIFAKTIVVPSHGLANELAGMYSEVAHKIEVIANPVDVPKLAPPLEFDRGGMRRSLGLMPHHKVFSFLALGDFARKGLDVVINAFTLLPAADKARARVVVIGGNSAEIREYQHKVSRAQHSENFQFVGYQKDPRPYLWASDVFVFPSVYETFSLAIHEAAAAGLPVIISHGLYGAEDFVVEGKNGWIVTRTAEGVCKAMRLALDMGEELTAMALNARKSVAKCGLASFGVRWSDLYSRLAPSHSVL